MKYYDTYRTISTRSEFSVNRKQDVQPKLQYLLPKPIEKNEKRGDDG